MLSRFIGLGIAATVASLIQGGGAVAATVDVSITGLAFGPASVVAKVGDTIQWTNRDFVAHTATSRDGSFDVVIPAHGSANLTVKAGTFDYYCRFHPMMKGVLQVGGD